MKKIFGNWEMFICTEDSFIEGETISLAYNECKTAKERNKHITRKVKFDKDAGDLYIIIKNKKYFASEFK